MLEQAGRLFVFQTGKAVVFHRGNVKPITMQWSNKRRGTHPKDTFQKARGVSQN